MMFENIAYLLKMKKRLLDVTRVILDKFSNRYHDYYGFWGIGVLYTHARHLNTSSFTFKLLNQHHDINDIFLEKVHQKFSKYLVHYLTIHHKFVTELSIAMIKIDIDRDHLLKASTLYGDYFCVQVELIDQKGQRFFAESDGYCFPHIEWVQQRKLIDSLSLEQKKFYWEASNEHQ
ncbi:hypothetical protein ACG94X_06835 [Acinetobacter sp. ULE_I010]|uniref:hypothetical protein n=1 Tax=Acinetobacter sp. ULE_I010 TaxID=3373065 RepID=UPI003AF83DB6